jgi:hypothetical protein
MHQQQCMANSLIKIKFKMAKNNLKTTLFAILFIATQALNTTAIAQNNGDFEMQGNLCLEHFKSTLKDPNSGYVRNITRDGTKFTMTLYAKNSYAAIVPKTIACENPHGAVRTIIFAISLIAA